MLYKNLKILFIHILNIKNISKEILKNHKLKLNNNLYLNSKFIMKLLKLPNINKVMVETILTIVEPTSLKNNNMETKINLNMVKLKMLITGRNND